jgi:aminopeptidase N
MDSFLRGWFGAHAFTAVGTATFEQEFAAAAGQELAPFFAGFLHRVGHPRLRVSLEAADGGSKLVVEQVQDTDAFAFPLDLEVATARGPKAVRMDLRSKREETLIRGAAEGVVVDPKGMVFAEVDCSQEASVCRAGLTCQSGTCK